MRKDAFHHLVSQGQGAAAGGPINCGLRARADAFGEGAQLGMQRFFRRGDHFLESDARLRAS
ncbi:MAG TPA: hypothetical protein VMD77_06770, partial [Candidatus Baltobacteraceae bacterium]|nr:hypothetical protein [Candidatus Baltobacteraceae bacterium]